MYEGKLPLPLTVSRKEISRISHSPISLSDPLIFSLVGMQIDLAFENNQIYFLILLMRIACGWRCPLALEKWLQKNLE
jgi:hypothetical protein